MLKSALIYLPAYLFPRLASFLVVLVSVRWLVPEQFGYFSLVMMIGELADGAMTNWVRIALSRFGAHSGGLSRAFAGRMAGIAAVCTLVAVALSSTVAIGLAPERADSLVAAVAAYVISAAFARFGVSLHQVQQNRKHASVLESLRALLGLGAVVTVMIATGEFVLASFAASGANFVIGVAAVATGFRTTNQSLPTETSLIKLLSFAFPLVIIALLSQAIVSLDKALLKSFHDAATLGLYAAAFAVGRAGFDVMAAAFNTGTFVQLSALFNNGKTEEARKLLSRQLGYLLAIALPAAGTLIAARDVIARLLFPLGYFETFVTAIPLIVIGAIALNLKHFVYDNIFHMYLRNLRQIPTLAVGAIVSAGIGFLLLPSHPSLGASSMFAAGGIAALVMSIWLTSSMMQITVPWRVFAFSTLMGVSAWVGGTWINALLADMIPNTGLLGILAGLGMVAVSSSLAWAAARKDGTDERPVTVLHVISSLGMGGAEKLLCDIVETGCSNKRFRYHVLVLNAVLDQHHLARLKRCDATIHLLHRPPGSRNPLYLLWSIRIMLVVRPQIVHCHNIHSVFWVLYTFGFSSRLFWTVHDTQVVPALSGFKRFLLRVFVDRFVAISRTVADDCRKAAFSETRCIHNGIDLSIYAPSDESVLGDNASLIVCVGRISSIIKGHDVLIEALAICRRLGVPVAAQLIGAEADGEPGVKARLESLVNKRGLAGSVEFLGKRNDIPQILHRGDIFVLPSRHEGFGLVLVEAMAAGLPVVASDIDGPREILRDGEDGLLFRSGDPDSLAQALIRLFHDSKLRRSLSAKGRARAQDFSISSTVAGYEALYMELI